MSTMFDRNLHDNDYRTLKDNKHVKFLFKNWSILSCHFVHEILQIILILFCLFIVFVKQSVFYSFIFLLIDKGDSNR